MLKSLDSDETNLMSTAAPLQGFSYFPWHRQGQVGAVSREFSFRDKPPGAERPVNHDSLADKLGDQLFSGWLAVNGHRPVNNDRASGMPFSGCRDEKPLKLVNAGSPADRCGRRRCGGWHPEIGA
jgi:hypothetical protein